MAMKKIIRRAAFDIGSGATKVQVADVDIIAGKIIQVLYEQEIPVPFSLDWKSSSSGNLSENIQELGLQTLQDLKSKAQNLNSEQYSAIATEVFRKAKNGFDYLDRVKHEKGIKVTVASQEEEALLGFKTGAAYFDGDLKNLVVWDSGGGSFQISKMNANSSTDFLHYLGAFGVGIVTSTCIEKIQGKTFAEKSSPNPDYMKTNLPIVPDWLLGSALPVAIGGPNSIFYLVTEIQNIDVINGTADFSINQVYGSIMETVGKSDEELMRYTEKEFSDPPSYILPKLVLLHSVMDKCKFENVRFQYAIGSCPGILISESLYSI